MITLTGKLLYTPEGRTIVKASLKQRDRRIITCGKSPNPFVRSSSSLLFNVQFFLVFLPGSQ